MDCLMPREDLSLAVRRDGPFDRVWESVGLTRRRQDAKGGKMQIASQHTTLCSRRHSTRRFAWRINA